MEIPEETSKPAAAAAAPEEGAAAVMPTATTPTRKAVKPALKKGHDEKESSGGSGGGGGSGKPKEDRHLKWDEAAIEEHDLLRGTRMKIDEPNTPYTHYDSGAESDGSARPKSPAVQKDSISWDHLQTRLDSVAAVQSAFPNSPGGDGGGAGGSGGTNIGDGSTHTEHSDAEEERRREMRQLEFKEHRKRHYNEMELVKKFRAEHPDGDFGEDDEDGDADDEA